MNRGGERARDHGNLIKATGVRLKDLHCCGSPPSVEEKVICPYKVVVISSRVTIRFKQNFGHIFTRTGFGSLSAERHPQDQLLNKKFPSALEEKLRKFKGYFVYIFHLSAKFKY